MGGEGNVKVKDAQISDSGIVLKVILDTDAENPEGRNVGGKPRVQLWTCKV